MSVVISKQHFRCDESQVKPMDVLDGRSCANIVDYVSNCACLPFAKLRHEQLDFCDDLQYIVSVDL